LQSQVAACLAVLGFGGDGFEAIFMMYMSFHASSAITLNSSKSLSIIDWMLAILLQSIGKKIRHPRTVKILRTTAAQAAILTAISGWKGSQ